MEAIIQRGNLYLSLKEYAKTISDCNIGYKFAIRQHDLKYQNLSSKYLYEAYRNLNNYKKALFYLEKHKKYQDSLLNEKNIRQVTQMQMQYQFDSENERKEIQKAAEKQSYKRIIYSLLLGLLTLFILAILSYRLYYLRQKNNIILKGKNKQIAKALKDNKILLKETHHRVKNSLQMISSLLYLQSENITDEKAASSVKDGQIRVKSMALIHQKLYQNNHLTGVEVSDYIHDLAKLDKLIDKEYIKTSNFGLKMKKYISILENERGKITSYQLYKIGTTSAKNANIKMIRYVGEFQFSKGKKAAYFVNINTMEGKDKVVGYKLD